MAKKLELQSYEETGRNGASHAPAHPAVTRDTAFGYPRDFLDNKFVYLVISPRAGGLSIGINVNPVLQCTFQCLYCEIDRAEPARATRFNVEKMAAELRGTIGLARSGGLRQLPRYAHLPEELLQVRHVAISGDGEPTLSAYFVEALETIVHLRVLGRMPLFQNRGGYEFHRAGSAGRAKRVKAPDAGRTKFGRSWMEAPRNMSTS